MTPQPIAFPRHRFPAEIIGHAVWLYRVFSLSLRDVALILAERGVVVTHESIRLWCTKFGGDFARGLKRRRPQPGDTWQLDEGAANARPAMKVRSCIEDEGRPLEADHLQHHRLCIRASELVGYALIFICQGVMTRLPLSHDKDRGPAWIGI